MSDYQTLRVLIWGKTYPELSSRYTETVCTGGVLEDGSPIRLYPVPLRYMQGEQQYALYDWIEVGAARNPRDNRRESYKIRAEGLSVVGHVPSNPRDGWRSRREWILRDTSWQFASMRELHEAQKSGARSMGLVTPGDIEEVRLVERTAVEREAFAKKWADVSGQADMFRTEYKQLDMPAFDVRLAWRCAERCPSCARKPHDMKVLDWGLVELGRREGWEAAKSRLESYADLKTHDFRLFLGNFFLHQGNFGIIGLWYPLHAKQLTFL